jgi:CelD/BcsL family acetyltransferase involved in cellulose biosynthesis
VGRAPRLDSRCAPAKVNLVGAAQESACNEVGEAVRPAVQEDVLTLQQLELSRVDWEELGTYPDWNIFQTREWLSFVEKTQQAQPVVAALTQDGEKVGLFTGFVVRRYGVRILGSPLRGWTTGYLGFNLRPGVSRRAAVVALPPFAFRTLRCLHVELRDRSLSLGEVEGLGWESSAKTIFELDLRRSEDEIFAGMESACRRCIRKAEKVGVTIEEANDPEFADDYYAQLRDVFAKQSLVPTYDKARVVELIHHLLPTGRLLLLRARDADGRCIATGIFPALNGRMYFWGGASWRSHQILRPNEALMWHAMRHWKTRGVEWCDLGGGAEYKRKYGPEEVTVPFFWTSRFRALSSARSAAKKAIKVRQAVRGRMTAIRSAPRES